MATDTEEVVELEQPDAFVLEDGADVQVRSAAQRELDIRIMPWRQVIRHAGGFESFVPGAFEGVDPASVRLLPPDDGGKHRPFPVGRGLSIQERDDGAYMTFKVAKTQLGDELLALAEDGVITGASVGFVETPGGSAQQSIGGYRVRVHERVGLDHVAITWRPAYQGAGIVAMRSAHEEGMGQMAEPQEAAAVAATPAPVTGYDLTPLVEELRAGRELQERNMDDLRERLLRVTEQQRSDIIVPSAAPRRVASIGEWATIAFRMLIGERVSTKELQERSLEDIITPENPGLVPDALLTSLIKGDINPGRPFLASTTQIEAPETGMSINVPIITQDVNAGVQNSEKGDVTSRALKVTTEDFPAKSIFGAADVSIQMLRRADRSFFSLFMRRLATAYARVADEQALKALFDSGVVSAGTGNIDPEDLTIGEAWENSMTATGEPPDTMWLSAEGVSAFINAKNDGSNSPLYFSLNAAFTVGGGPGGDVSALRPVYVPALDTYDVDVMIGPRSGFAWAEEAPIELTADVPSKAGRDIALGGIIFFLPLYPQAFTTYEIGS